MTYVYLDLLLAVERLSDVSFVVGKWAVCTVLGAVAGSVCFIRADDGFVVPQVVLPFCITRVLMQRFASGGERENGSIACTSILYIMYIVSAYENEIKSTQMSGT